MRRIVTIGIFIACLHFLLCSLIARVLPDSQIAWFFLGIFGHDHDLFFRYLLNPVFAVVAHFSPRSLYSWRDIHYTICLLLSSVVYGLIAALVSMLYVFLRQRRA